MGAPVSWTLHLTLPLFGPLMQGQNPVYTALHGISLQELFPAEPKVVESLNSGSSVEEAVKLLGSKGILSAPVTEESSGECIGIVDMLDIVSFVVSVAPDPIALSEDELGSLEICGRAMAFESVKKVMNASKRNPYVPVFESNPVTMATGLFADGVHRTPILDEELKIVHTVSQSDIVRHLAGTLHMGKLKVIGEKPVRELGLGQQGVVSIGMDETVLCALQKLKDHGISALAVVSEEGKLEGNFSASDLKGLYREHFPSLLLSVGDYLEKHSPKSLKPVCVQPETTFLDLCKEFGESHVHRLWVLGEDFKPSGVISLTDVMKVVQDYTYA